MPTLLILISIMATLSLGIRYMLFSVTPSLQKLSRLNTES
jgi:hypothetical protein